MPAVELRCSACKRSLAWTIASFSACAIVRRNGCCGWCWDLAGERAGIDDARVCSDARLGGPREGSGACTLTTTQSKLTTVRAQRIRHAART